MSNDKNVIEAYLGEA
ncbi:hypothetical protein GX420_02095 [bacterium]|nr:hypothetical protein [bacterium]